nr:MAG TPA: hypothetical protein [Caudoviricetes sp.]
MVKWDINNEMEMLDQIFGYFRPGKQRKHDRLLMGLQDLLEANPESGILKHTRTHNLLDRIYCVLHREEKECRAFLYNDIVWLRIGPFSMGNRLDKLLLLVLDDWMVKLRASKTPIEYELTASAKLCELLMLAIKAINQGWSKRRIQEQMKRIDRWDIDGLNYGYIGGMVHSVKYLIRTILMESVQTAFSQPREIRGHLERAYSKCLCEKIRRDHYKGIHYDGLGVIPDELFSTCANLFMKYDRKDIRRFTSELLEPVIRMYGDELRERVMGILDTVLDRDEWETGEYCRKLPSIFKEMHHLIFDEELV